MTIKTVAERYLEKVGPPSSPPLATLRRSRIRIAMTEASRKRARIKAISAVSYLPMRYDSPVLDQWYTVAIVQGKPRPIKMLAALLAVMLAIATSAGVLTLAEAL
jgi:hypothetical protein